MFLFPVRQKPQVILFPIFLGLFCHTIFEVISCSFFKKSLCWYPNMNYIKVIQEYWGNWHFYGIKFSYPRTWLALFQILFLNLPERLNPIMFLYFYFKGFISTNNILFCLVFKNAASSFFDKNYVFYLSWRCHCSKTSHPNNVSFSNFFAN